MTEIVALSELSDEPRAGDGRTPHWKLNVSPRLDAVLERLPVNNKTGTPTRIRAALRQAGIETLAQLVDADDYLLRRKNFGPVFRRDIDAALAAFGLSRRGTNPPVVVAEGAVPAEAHLEILQRWVAERLDHCERSARGPDGYYLLVNEATATESEVLTDVMLILDGREPRNERRRGLVGGTPRLPAGVTRRDGRFVDAATGNEVADADSLGELVDVLAKALQQACEIGSWRDGTVLELEQLRALAALVS